MLSCEEVSRLLSEAQERELSLKEKAALRMHTMMCKPCRNLERQLNFLRSALQHFTHTESKKDKGSENTEDNQF